MGAQSMKRRFWASLFQEKESLPDMSVREFCAMKNVSEKSYWYFHKVLSDKMEAEYYGSNDSCDNLPMFLEVKPESLSVKTGEKKSLHPCASIVSDDKRIRIEINEDISDEFLLKILKAVSHV